MPARKLRCDTKIAGANLELGDFWAWAYSDIISNTTRGVFAEFLVAAALGLTKTPRIEWDAVDLRLGDKKIEVKSAAYIQAWKQESPSIIRYDIAKRYSWDSVTNRESSRATRPAHCYVFCLYNDIDVSIANPLDLRAWHFYVLTTKQINREFGDQKSVGIAGLEALTRPVAYAHLKKGIARALQQV